MIQGNLYFFHAGWFLTRQEDRIKLTISDIASTQKFHNSGAKQVSQWQQAICPVFA